MSEIIIYESDQNQIQVEVDVFGKEKDESFQSSIVQIAKGFEEDDFYPTLEEKQPRFCI